MTIALSGQSTSHVAMGKWGRVEKAVDFLLRAKTGKMEPLFEDGKEKEKTSTRIISLANSDSCNIFRELS